MKGKFVAKDPMNIVFELTIEMKLKDWLDVGEALKSVATSSAGRFRMLIWDITRQAQTAIEKETEREGR